MIIEQWKPVVGYEGLYEVSDLGRVRSIHFQGISRIRMLSMNQKKNGYLITELSKGKKQKRIYVHKLVTQAFLGERPLGMEVNHKDGNKLNAALSNLEYVTQAENRDHALRTGLFKPLYGEDAYGAKLTNDKVRRMKKFRAMGMRIVLISKLFRLPYYHVSLILNGKIWNRIN
jgi:hypothetical protein